MMPAANTRLRRATRGRDLKLLCAYLALLTSCLARMGHATVNDEPDLGWIDRAALAKGEVLVRTEKDPRPLTVAIKVAVLIAAPPRAIWDVLVACRIAPEYVPNVVSCRSLEVVENGRAELFVQTVKPAFFLPTFEHVFRLDYEPYRRIGVHRVSGPIEVMDGTWWLLPQEGGATLVVYELAINPGMPVPRFFVRATLKRDLPRVLTAVKQRAEAGR